MEWANKTYPNTKFAFKDLKPDAMNPTMGKLHELFQRYPEVAQRVEAVAQHGGIESWAGTVTGHDKNRNAILLSKRWFGEDYDSLIASLRRDAASGWHPGGSDRVESIVAHEFGHVIERHLGATRPDEIKKFKESVAHITDLPSRYAAQSANEAFCEGFSQINFSPTLSEYAKRQKAFLEEMFGG
jgi:hypothetical protein